MFITRVLSYSLPQPPSCPLAPWMSISFLQIVLLLISCFICLYVYICLCVYMYVCVCIYMYKHIFLYVHVCMYVYIYACIYVHAYMYIYMYIHVYDSHMNEICFFPPSHHHPLFPLLLLGLFFIFIIPLYFLVTDTYGYLYSWIPCVRESMQCLSSWVGLILVNMRLHAFPCKWHSVSLFILVELSCVCASHFIYSSVIGRSRLIPRYEFWASQNEINCFGDLCAFNLGNFNECFGPSEIPNF